MGQQLDDKELVTFKEMLMANTFMTDRLVQLLFEKRVFYYVFCCCSLSMPSRLVAAFEGKRFAQ